MKRYFAVGAGDDFLLLGINERLDSVLQTVIELHGKGFILLQERECDVIPEFVAQCAPLTGMIVVDLRIPGICGLSFIYPTFTGTNTMVSLPKMSITFTATV